MTLTRKIEGRNHQCGDCKRIRRFNDGQNRAINAKGAKRCLRTHPSTVTAGLLPLGPDPVRLDPPRLETAFRPRLTRRKTQGRIIQWISSIASPSAFDCGFPRQPPLRETSREANISGGFLRPATSSLRHFPRRRTSKSESGRLARKIVPAALLQFAPSLKTDDPSEIRLSEVPT